MKWRVYSQARREDAPNEFLGLLTADTRDEALIEAARAWKGKRFLLISEAAWAAMDTRGHSFFEGTLVVTEPEQFRQVSKDVRASVCQGCGNDIFYRIHRNRSWRKPPTLCPSCDPKKADIQQHSAYQPTTE